MGTKRAVWNGLIWSRLICGVLAVAAGVCGPGVAVAQGQDGRAQELVKTAVQTELAADRDDHSLWQYRDVYQSPEKGRLVFRVVETGQGSLKKKVEQDGRPLNQQELKAEDARIQEYLGDKAEQARRHKDGEQDDRRAENLLRMLPDAFVWTWKGENGDDVTLSYVPNPQFDPPTLESRVFAAMAGEIVVSKTQHRIKSLQGTLISDVKFGWGLFGKMDKGGKFDVERRELAPGIWQITESHVHIGGHALLFKNIGQQEDEVKSEYRRTPPSTTLEQAATILKGEPSSLNAER